jgi:uncharacterized protein Yka (UPF0111/DUF47 family)
MVRLIPTDEPYFRLLDDLVGLLTEAAAQLADLLAAPEHAGPLVHTIREIEHRADEVTHEITSRLDRTFVTPFEPEDIHTLARRIGAVVDLAEDTAESVQTFDVHGIDQRALQLAGVLLRACHALASGVAELKKPKRVTAHTQRVKELEEEGDTVFAAAMEELFAGSTAPIEVLKRKSLYDWRPRSTNATPSPGCWRASR